MRPALDESAPAAPPLRARILEAAARQLHAGGPHALSLRRVAAEAGTSTQGIYTEFGGKQGLVEALYVEGWSRLNRAVDAIGAPASPFERLALLGDAYRACAYANRHFYELMIGRPVPGFEPAAAVRAVARHGFDQVRAAVLDVFAEERRDGDADHIAHLLWASVHGLVDLNINGLARADDEAQQVRSLTRALLDGLSQPAAGAAAAAPDAAPDARES